MLQLTRGEIDILASVVAIAGTGGRATPTSVAHARHENFLTVMPQLMQLARSGWLSRQDERENGQGDGVNAVHFKVTDMGHSALAQELARVVSQG